MLHALKEASNDKILFASMNNEFSYQFLDKIFEKIKGSGGTSDGLIYSPFSIFYIMQLVYMGSSGETRQELGRVLGHDVDNAQSESEIIKNMIQVGHEMTASNVFKIANGFFLEKSYNELIKENYRKLMDMIGQIEGCDFQGNASQEVLKINSWVKEKTNGLIPQILSVEDISCLTKLILVNTIYFKASWKYPFKKSATQDQEFINMAGGGKIVPMMTLEERLPFFEDNRIQILSMPYKNKLFAMDFFLPKRRGRLGMTELVEKMSSKNYYCVKSILKTDVEVYLPRFTQRYNNSLNELFQDCGANKMFSAGSAEFENMITPPVGSAGYLYISNIIHGAVVIVDEEGTEAAAATAIMYDEFCMADDYVPVFRADHPFLYQIRYLPKNLVLFQGIFDGESSA